MSDITQFQSLLGSNMQGFSSGAGTSLIRMPDGSVRRVGVNNIPGNATPLSVDGRKINIAGENSGMPELVEQGGVMVAKERATGLARPFASTADWITGNYFDFDRQGSGTGVAHPQTGAGGLAKDFEKGPDGTIKKVVPEIDDFKKATGSTLDEYIKKMEGVQSRAATKKFERETLGKMPDVAHAAFGGSYAAALGAGTKGITAAATATSGMRPYQFSAAQLPSRMNFASLLG